mmetsp:Transcript_38295/g.95244  ORF Transcript_38295/g.95244 Transcript_38295/m.95244 type:complete len:88 (-) Transcript_38295:728-991(-)
MATAVSSASTLLGLWMMLHYEHTVPMIAYTCVGISVAQSADCMDSTTSIINRPAECPPAEPLRAISLARRANATVVGHSRSQLLHIF